MTLTEIITALQAAKIDIADAITAKGGTVAAGDGFSDFAAAIASISAGPEYGLITLKDINFYDYDGFLCYSWTLAELASASALPANPTHAGLTAQGWNWSLADLKTENAKMNVGQMYVTDDGKTRLYITIAALGRMVVPLYWSQTVASGVSIDWGDGSSAETFTGTGNKNTTHTYSDIGNYMITLTATSGELGFGNGTSAYSVMGSTSSTDRVYQNMLQKAEIGSNISSIGTYAFSYCYSLASVTIPSNISSIGSYAFQYCYSLASVTIPSSVSSIGTYAFSSCYPLASITIPSNISSIGSYAFQYCYSLASITIPSNISSIDNNTFFSCYSLVSITIPSGVSSIGSSAFNSCRSLVSITIPSGVSSIGSSAFNSCEGMAAYHILPVTPPTLASTNAFTNIPSDCVIYVPNASLAAYQSATNWSTYEAKMVGE